MNQLSKPSTLLAIAAMLGHCDLESLVGRQRPSRFSCCQCGKEIPPGKSGRRCQECRSIAASSSQESKKGEP